MSKDKEIQEVLAMLDMSEDEQIRFIQEKFAYSHPGLIRKDFAALAFRMRDEAQLLNQYMWACAQVYNYAHGYKPKVYEIHAPTMVMWIWFATYAQPIHFIAAAMITEILAKERKNLTAKENKL